jgi:hypothetical protein
VFPAEAMERGLGLAWRFTDDRYVRSTGDLNDGSAGAALTPLVYG